VLYYMKPDRKRSDTHAGQCHARTLSKENQNTTLSDVLQIVEKLRTFTYFTLELQQEHPWYTGRRTP